MDAEKPTESKEEFNESQKLWQEYLQRCCEVGQIRHQLDQLDTQKREIEKNLEITERKVKSTAQLLSNIAMFKKP